MFNGHIEIHCDGGCENNGSPDARAYGSFVLRAVEDDQVVKLKRSGRLDYPQHTTNNAAEVQAFIDALSSLKPGDYRVLVMCDSRLVVNWINGVWDVNAEHLFPLVEQARERARCFPALEVVWVAREKIVRQLGH